MVRQREKEIAKERIDILVGTALKERDESIAASQALLAKKIAMHFRIRLPYNARQLFCKKCKAFIVPGRGSRVRVGKTNTKAIRITCTKCGHTYRKVIGRSKDL